MSNVASDPFQDPLPIHVEERLPESPLWGEVVLHVRHQLRKSIRRKSPSAAHDLALLFGLSAAEGEALQLKSALKTTTPQRSAAEIIGRARRTSVVALGHDEAHQQQCYQWLLERKQAEPAFEKIIAFDPRTLLELSTAIDLATWESQTVHGVANAVPILIEGPTGSGKEMVAQAIHTIWQSKRNPKGLFVPVQVAGMPKDMILNELFGSVKGAFTGATRDRKGKLQLADGGTLFVDQAGDLPPEAQVGLLRFLQDQVVYRLGDNTPHPVKTRILAATWHNLEQDAESGGFRLDLLHRLQVGRIKLPSLIERGNSFPQVVCQMIAVIGGRRETPINRSALDALSLHHWPGNLRELEGVLRIAVSSAEGDTIRLEDLPPWLQAQYLRQPLVKRVPGILCDQLEDELPTAALITARVQELSSRLNVDVSVAPDTQLTVVRELLSGIPDPHIEHQALLQRLDEASRLSAQRKHLTKLVEYWDTILDTGLPPLVDSVVTAERARAYTHVTAAREHEQAQKGAFDLTSSPWWSLWDEFRNLPIFGGQPESTPRELWNGFQFVLKGLFTAVPDYMPTIRETISREGIKGLKRIWKDILGLLEGLESGNHLEIEEAESEDERSKIPPSRRPREFWLGLVAKCNSKAEASRYSYDQKTITKYLLKHGIPERWGEQPEQGDGPEQEPVLLPQIADRSIESEDARGELFAKTSPPPKADVSSLLSRAQAYARGLQPPTLEELQLLEENREAISAERRADIATYLRLNPDFSLLQQAIRSPDSRLSRAYFSRLKSLMEAPATAPTIASTHEP